MTLVKVSPHTWSLEGEGDDVYHSYGANQGLIITKESCLIVDSGFHDRTARELLAIARRERQKTIYVLDTHYHSDHVFGNGLLSHAGAVIIAQENCRRSMVSHSRTLLSKYQARNSKLRRLLKNVQVVYPTVTFGKQLTLNLDDDTTVDIVHPTSRAHTDGDSIAVVREDDVVYAGDIFWNRYHPNLEDADIKGQIQALEWILETRPKKIIPGHGHVAAPEDVRLQIRYLRYLHKMIETAQSSRQRGKPGRLIPPWSRRWKMRWLMDQYLQELMKR